MECQAYATAESYNLNALKRFFKQQERKITVFNKEIIALEEGASFIFFFDFGCVVFWNVPQERMQGIFSELVPFSEAPHHEHHKETFTYEENNSGETQIADEHFSLGNEDELEKIAISFGLAQSVKLDVLEARLETQIEETKSIPLELAEKGRISRSQREISKQMGRLFLEKSAMNLYSEFLDTPEFFWDRSHLKHLYNEICHIIDLDDRIHIANKRLDMVQEIYSLLSGELQHQHSSFLEWIIIILISIEIALSLLKL
jgi:uncharacterized Rmd1/YagE family protein